MELAVEDGFDIHAYRDQLKLLERTRTTTHLENRDGLICPACGKSFNRLLVSEERTHTFGDPGSPFCLVRTDDRVLVITH